MGPFLQKNYNFYSFRKKGTGDREECIGKASTGDSEDNEFIIKKINLDKYSISVLLTSDNRFVDILEIETKKQDFSSPYSSGDQSIDVNDEYPE